MLAEAESLYQDALNNAQVVSAAMPELQAATGLSRLWNKQGKKEKSTRIIKRRLLKNNRRLHNGRPERSQKRFSPHYRHEAKS